MKRLYLLLLVLIAWLPVSAQVNVSIQIIPPYPTRITDYASRPELMVISVTNTTNPGAGGRPLKIQLRGAVTGDNGVELRVRNTYKSPSPIVLAPGEVRMLNGANLKYFFDYTKIDYKGISQNEFISKNGLQEGTYRFCIRAYDYDTNQPISADEPVGCSNVFTISSLEPPSLITPAVDATVMAQTGQNFLMQWSTPPGTSPQIMSSVHYRIRMVEIMGNRNANDAIRSATQPYFFEKEVVDNAYVYNAADPQLTPGRRYAWMVEAFDPYNNTPFRNNGRSEVRVFTYGSSINTLPPPPLGMQPNRPLPIMGQVSGAPVCSCTANVPTDASANNQLKVNSIVSVGSFKMAVQKINQPSSNNGPVSGEGTIGLPFIGSVAGGKLKVTFTDLDVNTQLVMKSGNVEGILSENADPSMIPTADAPGLPALQVTPQNARSMQTYLAQFPGQMLDALKTSADQAGFKLPIGISAGPVTLAIARVHFNAKQAWFDAIGAVDIPDGGANSTLALSGKGICIGNGKDFYKDGQVFLTQDFAVNEKLKLLKATNNANDPGTSITFKGDGKYTIRIGGEYTFPNGTLKDKQSNEPLKARLTGTTTSGWTDWLAQLKMPDFYVDGMQSVSFSLGNRSIWYDHSDFQNPAGMPVSFKSPDPADPVYNVTPNLWQGFYIPEVDVQLPAIIKNVLATDKPVTVAGQNMVFDSQGFTGTVTTKGTVLELINGSMGGWYASIDNVNLQFFKSAFKASSMTGKFVLPASKDITLPQNQLTYNAKLTSGGGNGIAYEFNVAPTFGELNFDALFMRVKLTEGTAIHVQGSSNESLKADINMNGELSIINRANGTNIAGIGKLSLPYLKFWDLKFQTYGDYINTDKFKFELTSGAGSNNDGGNPGNSGIDYIPEQSDLLGGPNAAGDGAQLTANDGPGSFSKQQNLGGFDFSLKSHGLKLEGNKIVFSLSGGVSLAQGPIACEAEGTFSLVSAIKTNDKGRIVWTPEGGRVDSVALGVGAALGPLRIKGAIRYYNKSTEEGFIGALETGVGGLLTVNMRAQFGSMFNTPQGDYKYFSFNAMCDFGQTGITFAPPIPLAFYGFGGGIFYNMQIDKSSLPQPTTVPASQKVKDVDDKDLPSKHGALVANPLDLLDQNPSGIRLTPNKGTFGGEATVLFGLTSRNTLDADATLSLTLNEHGGISNVHFLSNVRLLTDVSKPLTERRNASTGAGTMIIDLNPDLGNAFLASLDIELGVPNVNVKSILYARGGGQFRYNNANDWSLKIGSPRGTVPGPNELRLLDFISGTSYFEVGTNIDDMPGIDPDILAIVQGGKDPQKNQVDQLQKPQQADRVYSPSKNTGLILGGALEMGDKKEHRFLMFYGTLYAKAGFDIAVNKGMGCDNVPGAGGPGGWYARGSAYLGAQAKIGVEINLLLIKGKFTIFDAGAAAIVTAGLPNPNWVEGTLGGYFKLLDGAISSNFRFQFSIGQKCVNANADAFGGLQIISQISPPAGTNDKVPLNATPGVVFNVKNGGPFLGNKNTTIKGDFEFDDYENTDENGNPQKRFFRFDRSCVTATLNGKDVTENLYGLDEDGYAFGYKSTDYLAKNTEYKFKVSVKMLEGRTVVNMGNLANISSYVIYDKYVQKRINGVNVGDAHQDTTTTFTTDDGFSAIPASEYALTTPLHSHKAVPTINNGMLDGNKMTIETKRVVNNLNFFKYPEGTSYYARIYRNGVREGADLPIDMRTVDGPLADGTRYSIVNPSTGSVNIPNARAHSRWTFTPPALKPNSSYVVIVIGKAPGATAGNATESTTQTSNYVIDNNTVMQVQTKIRTIANRINSLSPNENVVAGYNFQTSNFDTYERKLRELQIKELTRLEDGSKLKLSNSKFANKTTFTRWIKPEAGKYKIVLGYGLGGFNFPVQATLVGERFSRADLSATTSDNVFQPVYDNAGIPRSNGIAQRYNSRLETDYGADYIKLRRFIANCTGIPVTDISVMVSPPPPEVDNGAVYCYNRGHGDAVYSENQTDVGAPVPTALPQAESADSPTAYSGMAITGISLPSGLTGGMGLIAGTPVVYETFGAVTHECQSRGQMTFTDPIQRQIDKMKNWAVNPGDNMMNPGINSMQNVSYWENVSTATSGYMTGSVNQSQLQNAVQGAKRAGAGIR